MLLCLVCVGSLLAMAGGRPQGREERLAARLYLQSLATLRPQQQQHAQTAYDVGDHDWRGDPNVVHVLGDRLLDSLSSDEEDGNGEDDDEEEDSGDSKRRDWSLKNAEYVLAFINVTYIDPISGQEFHRSGQIGKYATGEARPAAGQLVHASSHASRSSHHGCDPVWQVRPTPADWVALVRRGHCNFEVKVQNALRLGARAVIIYDHRDGRHLHQIHLNPQQGEAIVTVFIAKEHGEDLAHLVDSGGHVYVQISPGQRFSYASGDPSKTSVLFVAVSFLMLMGISFAWLLFYYLQRFRYLHSRDQLKKRLVSAAKQTLSKVPMRTVKPDDQVVREEDSCAVCLEAYASGDELRQLPCSHEFHTECVDPWLLRNRTCPMCKMDILKYFGLRGVSEESLVQLELAASPSRREAIRRLSSVGSLTLPYTESTDGSRTRRLSSAGSVTLTSTSAEMSRAPSRLSEHSRMSTATPQPLSSSDHPVSLSPDGGVGSATYTTVAGGTDDGVRSRRVSTVLMRPLSQRSQSPARRYSAPSQHEIGADTDHPSLGRSASSPAAGQQPVDMENSNEPGASPTEHSHSASQRSLGSDTSSSSGATSRTRRSGSSSLQPPFRNASSSSSPELPSMENAILNSTLSSTESSRSTSPKSPHRKNSSPSGFRFKRSRKTSSSSLMLDIVALASRKNSRPDSMELVPSDRGSSNQALPSSATSFEVFSPEPGKASPDTDTQGSLATKDDSNDAEPVVSPLRESSADMHGNHGTVPLSRQTFSEINAPATLSRTSSRELEIKSPSRKSSRSSRSSISPDKENLINPTLFDDL